MRAPGTLLRLTSVVVLAGVGVAALTAAIVPQAASLATAHVETASLPELNPLAQRSVMYAADGSVMAVLKAEENRKPVALSQVPQPVIDTVLAVEDAEFYQHRGINARSLIRALLANVSAGGVTQGGSTITQQVVKNALLTPKRDANRKIKEAVYAVRLERTMTKDEILERYLNTVYFGNGAYGVQAAAELYFGTDVGQLGYPQAAFLAGLIRNPVGYDPFRFPARATDRRRVALNRLVDVGKLTRDQADLIDATPIPTAPQTTRGRGASRGLLRRRGEAAAARRCAARRHRPRAVQRGLQGRLADLHDVRPEDAARGTAGPQRPASRHGRQVHGRARGARPSDRGGEGDGRWPGLREREVQPRDAGGAATGLVVQDVRARRRARGGRTAHRHHRRHEPVPVPVAGRAAGLRDLERGRRRRADLEDDRPLDQLRVRATRADRRPRPRDRHRSPHGHHREARSRAVDEHRLRGDLAARDGVGVRRPRRRRRTASRLLRAEDPRQHGRRPLPTRRLQGRAGRRPDGREPRDADVAGRREERHRQARRAR